MNAFFKTVLMGILLANFHPAGQARDKKPNIIFFLVDDMGWMDCTINGSQYYETPNMERLAAQGMVFKNAYTANTWCSPTRASILTGKYPARFGFTLATGHWPANPGVDLMAHKTPAWFRLITPKSRNQLPLEEVTIAEKLKEDGYATAFIGKWHMGEDPYSPENQGFDINIAGGPNAVPSNYFSPYRRDDSADPRKYVHKNLSDGPLHEYLTDRLTDEAIRFIEAEGDRPFFLHLSHFAVHGPWQGKLSLVKKYQVKTDPRGRQDNPIMGAMLESMDESLGRIMDKLEALHLSDNTVIIFYSDNGGSMSKPIVSDLFEGTKVPTNNYPLRSGKGSNYEGGIRVPCIVYWPGKVKPGTVSNEVISSIDWYPTIVEMVKGKYIGEHPVDGVSLASVLKGEGKLKREAIFCHLPSAANNPTTSVRKGSWKLIRSYGDGTVEGYTFQLYNLTADIGERNNLADKMPAKVKELDRLISKHIKDIGNEDLLPRPNPVYDPSVKMPVRKRKPHNTDRFPMY